MAENALVMDVTEDIIEINNKRRSATNSKNWWRENWRAILSEFVATKFLLLLGCMGCVPIDGFLINPPLFGALGFGLIVLINIQTFGHISGAHMNPAVTLAAVIWGKMSIVLGIAYFIAQTSGALIGYGILIGLSPKNLFGGVCITRPHAQHSDLQALGVEIFLTASLVFINCAVWDPVNADKNESDSIKFGLTVAGLSIVGGPLTGAGMNPSRSLAPAVWTNIWTAHWVYWVGPFAGSVVAAVFYKYVWLQIKNVQVDKMLVSDKNNNNEEQFE